MGHLDRYQDYIKQYEPENFPHNSKDIYGKCPTCGKIAWHRYMTDKAVIFDVGKAIMFRCRWCKKQFGFIMEKLEEPKCGSCEWFEKRFPCYNMDFNERGCAYYIKKEEEKVENSDNCKDDCGDPLTGLLEHLSNDY